MKLSELKKGEHGQIIHVGMEKDNFEGIFWTWDLLKEQGLNI